MLEKNLIKLIRSLEQKKYRKRTNLFVAEGPKTVVDIMSKIRPKAILATPGWVCPATKNEPERFITVTDNELSKASFLQHPQQVIGLFPIKQEPNVDELSPQQKLILAIDGVQDPGNLGTIIRIADWFGIDTVACSYDTVDAYNPKTVQATMGSIARVNVLYTDLAQLFDRYAGAIQVYGTSLDGESIYETKLCNHGFIVMGNEGNGISIPIRKRLNKKLLIPSFGNNETAESLNVAIATAITCSEFRRRQ